VTKKKAKPKKAAKPVCESHTAGVPRSQMVKVRCLAPGKEHYFLSVDKTYNRICNRCQGRRNRIDVYLTMTCEE